MRKVDTPGTWEHLYDIINTIRFELPDFRNWLADAALTDFKIIADKYKPFGFEKELNLKDMQIKSIESGLSTLYEENERLKKTNDDMKKRLHQISLLMNENTSCDDIYHFLCCHLGKFTPDEFDCTCCSSEKCNKRLCKYDREIF